MSVLLDVTPRLSHPDRRVNAVRGCAAVGQTIQVRARALRLPPDEASAAAPAADAIAVAVPYFQWDNRDGGAMRVWLPRAR